MSARRIARELAVILLPQLPRDKAKLERLEFETLLGKAVRMLCDYAKHNLGDANALLVKWQDLITNTEIEHPANRENVEHLDPVPLTTAELRSQLDLIERSMQLISEALDIPEMTLYSGFGDPYVCKNCGADNHPPSRGGPSHVEAKEFLYALVTTFIMHKQEIDTFIRRAKAKWRIERMISIDRDILRLACAEAFFMPDVPLRVAISEAVELSHRFADERAAKFINGMLRDLSEEAAHYRREGTFMTPKDEDGNNGSHVTEASAQ